MYNPMFRRKRHKPQELGCPVRELCVFPLLQLSQIKTHWDSAWDTYLLL